MHGPGHEKTFMQELCHEKTCFMHGPGHEKTFMQELCHEKTCLCMGQVMRKHVYARAVS